MAETQVWIFDVEHGSMAFVRAPSGATLVIDCGKAAAFSPSRYVYQHELTAAEREATYRITKFVVTHPHDDHIEDIETFTKMLKPWSIYRHKYDWDDVASQSNGDYENLRDWEEFQGHYNQPTSPVDWGELEIAHYCLSVDEAKSLNESKYINNSSIITIITVNGFKIVFPGDIEKDGWQEILRQRGKLAKALSGTDVFVTAHHGHSSGYAPEVYDAMGKPYFNISSIHHGDTKVHPAYSTAERAQGAEWEGQTRYHFTTRQDGSCRIRVGEDGKWRYGFYKLDDNLK